MEPPSTPPRGGMRLRTPPTPLHGPQHDEFAPYSPPRRSSRKTLSSNPYSSTNSFANKIASMPAAAAKKPAFGLGYAPSDCFSSPPASPINHAVELRKQSQLPNTPRRVDNNNNTNNSEASHDLLDPSSSVRKPIMLLTPTKTPTMTPARKHSRATSLQLSARALHFQPEDPNDSMPTRQQSSRARKFRRLDFESDEIAGSSRNNDFDVYTESHARVPHLDTSGDNPFYRARANTIPQDACPSPPLIRAKTSARVQEESAMHEAAARNEGMIFSFRGRKVFQRFADSDDNDADTEADVRDPSSMQSQRALRRSAGAAAQRPITRSQIKPRLLFPRDTPLATFTDEEAETDIEVPTEETPKTRSTKSSMPATPAKAKVAHEMTPPSKARASRKRDVGDVSVYEDETATVNGAAAGLPTPARSSKKKQKHVIFNDIPVYEEGTPEPVPADGDSLVEAHVPTPQRSARRKTKVQLNLTPVAEDESEYELAGASSSPIAGARRSTGSPFDNWPRTKSGLKRDGEPLAGAASKRTRSAAASSSVNA